MALNPLPSGSSLNATVSICGNCSKTQEKMSHCAACNLQSYCSKDCQRTHWPEHKLVCQLQRKKCELSQKEVTPITPEASSTDFQQVDKIVKVAHGVIFPSVEVLDPGIEEALFYFKRVIEKSSIDDPYSMLLKQLFIQSSEEQAIQLVKEMGKDEKKQLIEESLLISENSEKNIACDVLRLSALQGWFNLLRYLFDMMKEHNLKSTTVDRFGWNVAHFVALHSRGEFPINGISALNELLNSPNKSGASPRDFVYWLSEPAPVAVAVFGKEHPLLEPKQFQQQVNGSYWIRPRFTPGVLLRSCFESLEVISGPKYLSTFMGPKIDNYINNIENQPCKLKIRKMQGPSTPSQLQGEWECLLSQDVTKGEILELYTGTVIHSTWRGPTQLGKKAHSVCNDILIDADIGGGSLVQFINHAFPNCACIYHLYRGLPVIAVVALDNLRADSPLFLSYGPTYFTQSGIIPENLNPEGIAMYLKATQKLRKVPYLDFEENGEGYCYCKNGKTVFKKVSTPPSESNAIDGWSNKMKLEYLQSYHSNTLKKQLRTLEFKWLEENFKRE